MTRCFLCKKKLTDAISHALADLEKPMELKFNKEYTVRAKICLDCIPNPEVLRYKRITVDQDWTRVRERVVKVVGA